MKIAWNGNAVEVRDLGSGPPVVLLHGSPLDGAMWSGVARLLSENFRVVKPDLPGRGDTPPAPTPGMDAYAGFVEAILDELPSPAGVAGFSMGGYVALALMRRAPARVGALALVDTRAAPDSDSGRAARDEAIAVAREKGVEPIAEGMLPKLLSSSALANRDTVERVRRIMLRQSRETVAADLVAMRDRPDSTAFLGEIRVPTRVIVGAEDTISPPEEARAMADAIPGADCVVIPGVGHLSPVERPRAVATALGEFFSRALGANDDGSAAK
jgi:3-oxoadipate enol-lactonase